MVMVLVPAIVLPVKGGSVMVLFALYLLTFFSAHIFLGKAARQSGRSWVYFGVLPVFWPVAGAIISYAVLSKKIKNDNP